MSNHESTEYGWVVIQPNGSKVLRKALENMDVRWGEGLYIPNAKVDEDTLYIETHPHNTNKVFVSLGKLKHGVRIAELQEPEVGQTVRDYIESLDPDALVVFGVILTQR